jgi:dTDP-4-dehydrorhamnose reductase
MKFAVVGNLGMLGQEIESVLIGKGHQVLGFNRTNLDLTRPTEAIAESLGDADVLVNTMAYTMVDQAEDNEELANLINGEYAGKLAQVARVVDAKFMHVSTDYVYSGTDAAPISTNAKPSPVNAYGRSKLLGEELVALSQAKYQIFRTAWLYGATGGCFPKSIIKKCFSEGSANVVNDQFGQPTWTRDVAEVIYAHSIDNYAEPIVHAVSSGSASWFDFARVIVYSDRFDGSKIINPTPSSELDLRAIRPRYSVLDNSQTVGPVIGNWLDRWKRASDSIFDSIK